MGAAYFFIRGGRERGPFSANQLRQLAANGEITLTDVLRKDGTDMWVPCSSVKGLFPETPTSSIDLTQDTDADHTSSPPPVPEHKSAASALDGVTRESLAGLKAAAKLTANRTERTKLMQVDLPAAYLALGQAVFEGGTLRDRFSDEYSRIDGIRQNMLSISQRQSEKPATLDGIVEKAKASASKAAGIAEHKLLQIRLNSQLRDLGKKSFDKLGSEAGPPELVEKIANLRASADALQSESAELAQSAKSSTSDVLKTIEPMRRNAFVIAASLLCCFPAGLFFVWKHPQWSTRTKLIWTGCFGGMLMLGMIGNALESEELTAEFLPHKPGAVAYYESDLGTAVMRHRYRFEEDGQIVQSLESVSGKYLGDIPPTIKTHTTAEGYVGTRVASTGLWDNRLKLGAKVGESWTSDHDVPMIWTVENFGTYRTKYDGLERRSVTIRVQCKTENLDIDYREIYVEGIGFVLRTGRSTNIKVNVRLDELAGGKSNKNLTDAERAFFR